MDKKILFEENQFITDEPNFKVQIEEYKSSLTDFLSKFIPDKLKILTK
jgi:hypothetical protein